MKRLYSCFLNYILKKQKTFSCILLFFGCLLGGGNKMSHRWN